MRKIAFIALICILTCVYPLIASAEEDRQLPEGITSVNEVGSPQEQTTSFSDMIKSGFSYNLRALLFLNYQFAGRSTQNPENAFLRLYRYSGEIHLQPDFFLDTPLISGYFKPRFIFYKRWWKDGITAGDTHSKGKVLVNEWLAQLKLHSSLFISFGKEKLLWGPSFLASPSNILFKDTEKVNPFIEVEGKYLAKAVYMPNLAFTVSLITETRHDENEIGERAQPLQALKVDLMGTNYSLSLIGYHRPDDRFRLGSFGQWTASDALILYYDGIVSKGTDALYPLRDQNNPLGGEFIKKYDHSGRLFATVTTGGAYTFLTGATLSVEFLYNGSGYSDAEAEQYYMLRKSAADNLFAGESLSNVSQNTLLEALNTGSLFLRRYYLMAQFQQREIKSILDIILRYIHGLEEGSGQLSSILECRISNRIQLFNINTIGIGGRNSEFRSILSKSVMVGIEVFF